MLVIVGTVPQEDFPLTAGPVAVDGGWLEIMGRRAPINRGTPALVAAALRAGEALGGVPVFAYLVGDLGTGQGSRRLYAHLVEDLGQRDYSVLVFHYLQPDVDWHNKVLWAIPQGDSRPLLVADAGFMYAAKMSGQAGEYDLFTPDVGELAFLADEVAPHPFYTRGFILHEDNRVPELITRAYAQGNAARHLLVKGAQDYLASGAQNLKALSGPSTPALEAIGGTGDTLTGLVAALMASGRDIPQAASLAARANRLAGQMAQPTPATQILEIIDHIPAALAQAIEEEE